MNKQKRLPIYNVGKFLKLVVCSSLMGTIFSLSSCNKYYLTEPVKNAESQVMNFISSQQDIMAPYRKVSPYSLKVVRLIRAEAAKTTDLLVKNKLLAPLKTANYQLYYKIVPDIESKANVMNNWVNADSNRILVSFPIDSVSLFPQNYPPATLDSLEEKRASFYTTVPLNAPLPSGMGATILDTL